MAAHMPDPASMKAAGKMTFHHSKHEDHRRPDLANIVDATKTIRRTATEWYAPGTGRVGELKAERDMPNFAPARSVDHKLMTADIEGATAKPHGLTVGRRLLPNGIYATYKADRNTNPLAPVYNLPSASAGKPFPTLPSQLTQPEPKLRDSRGPIDVGDIQGCSPATYYKRNTPFESLNYNDVSNAKSTTQTLMNHGGSRRDDREQIDVRRWPAVKWRPTPTHPLDPAYQMLSQPPADTGPPRITKPPSPALHEVEGRMAKLTKHGCGDLAPRTEQEGRRYRGNGLKNIHTHPPFPPLS